MGADCQNLVSWGNRRRLPTALDAADKRCRLPKCDLRELNTFSLDIAELAYPCKPFEPTDGLQQHRREVWVLSRAHTLSHHEVTRRLARTARN